MDPRPTPEPTELIYVPGPTWAPVLAAAGITLLALGTFMGWVLWAIGAIVLLLGARSWWRRADDEIGRMRVRQDTDTAIVPADPIRRS